jgi:Flp pilus assembly protein TadD
MHRDPRKGVEALVKSVTISEALTKEFPADARYWERLAHHRSILAHSLADQGLKTQATEELHQAMDAFETAARLAPDDCRVLNTLAWHLVLSDELTLHNPSRAVVLARRAVELQPDYFRFWFTLGIAYYHAGNWGEAVAALERGLGLMAEKSVHSDQTSSTSFDTTMKVMAWFYLAMAYDRLGNAPKARLWHDKAVKWTDKNVPPFRELQRLCVEAAALLGNRQQPPVQNAEPAPRKK